MNEHEQPKNDGNTAAALKKMQYQLDAIERKVDTLLKSSGGRDYKSRYESKPYRGHDQSNRPFKAKHAKRKVEASSEGKFYHKLQSGPKKNQSYRGPQGKKT